MLTPIRTLYLERLKPAHHSATFGVLKDDSQMPFAVTLELPWRFNKKNKSCIPPGTYICRKYNSPKYGRTFIVKDTTGRKYILFHPGNWKKNTKGCILVGESYEIINGKFAIAQSKKGFKEFMAKYGKLKEFQLCIS